jgi:20S proteasome alpha/beta subunit
MSDLINRDELIVRLNRVKKTYKIDDRVIGTVSGMPAVDAESVRYGRWIRGGANDMHGVQQEFSPWLSCYYL